MYNPSYKKIKKISNQVKPRAQDQIRNSFTPRNANIRSLNDLERERLGSVKGNLINKRIRIKGFTTVPDVFDIFQGFWNFDDPDGNEVVNYTFNFSGNLLIDDFGDGTKESNVISDQTLTKSYS